MIGFHLLAGMATIASDAGTAVSAWIMEAGEAAGTMVIEAGGHA